MHLSELLTLDDVERRALSVLPSTSSGFIRSGADNERCLCDNVEAFNRFLLLPRMLVDVSSLNTETSLFGQCVSMPVAFAASSMQKLSHPDGEIATAKVAARHNLLMVLSTSSSFSLEEVGCIPSLNCWFQLYVYKDRNVTRQLVQRAEKAGYRALVVTVDAPVLGRRLADLRSKFVIPTDIGMANLRGMLPVSETSGSLGSFMSKYHDTSLTWELVDWLRSVTSLPVVVKGLLTAEDAMVALSHGAAGIIVSNHGGRQLDSAPAAIEALPAVVKAVAGRCPVMVDGGVRRGTDVLKALALGAKMVFVGRPVPYGLAVGGEAGLDHVVNILHGELTRAMALCGCPDASNISSSIVMHRRRFSAQL